MQRKHWGYGVLVSELQKRVCVARCAYSSSFFQIIIFGDYHHVGGPSNLPRSRVVKKKWFGEVLSWFWDHFISSLVN